MKKLFFILSASFTVAWSATAQNMQQLKTYTAFIYVKGDTSLVPKATCFFVGINPNKDSTKYDTYLITAKHNLRYNDVSFYDSVYIRVNDKRLRSVFIHIKLTPDGKEKNVYFNKDASVDLAVIPLKLGWDTLAAGYLHPYYLNLTKKDDFNKFQIRQGTDIFYIGLFDWYQGVKQLEPIVRFGKIAMIPKASLIINRQKIDLMLIDCREYGSSEGAPVYCKFPANDGKSSHLLLAGVVCGYFRATDNAGIDTNILNSPINNDGITCVVPVYQLRDILYGEELRQYREKQGKTYMIKLQTPR